MIWSVSTLGRSSGMARPVCVRSGCILFELPAANVGEMAGHGRGRRHHGTDEMGPPASSLAAFEVAIAGGGAPLARLQDVGVNARTHGAARLRPFESGATEDAVEPFAFRIALDRLGAGDNHRPYLPADLVASDHAGGGAQVFDAPVGAGTDKDPIDVDLFNSRAGLQVHVFERAGKTLAVAFGGGLCRVGNAAGDRRNHSRAGAPTDKGRNPVALKGYDAIEGRAFIRGQGAPVVQRFQPCVAFGRESAAFEKGERPVLRRDPSRPPAGANATITQGHAAFPRKRAPRFAGGIADMSGGAVGNAFFPDGENEGLGG